MGYVIGTGLVGSSAFGMTIQLISASVYDYNDNTGLCSGKGRTRGRAMPPKGCSSFSAKVFATQMRLRTGPFISTPILLLCSHSKGLDNRLPRQRH